MQEQIKGYQRPPGNGTFCSDANPYEEGKALSADLWLEFELEMSNVKLHLKCPCNRDPTAFSFKLEIC